MLNNVEKYSIVLYCNPLTENPQILDDLRNKFEHCSYYLPIWWINMFTEIIASTRNNANRMILFALILTKQIAILIFENVMA